MLWIGLAILTISLNHQSLARAEQPENWKPLLYSLKKDGKESFLLGTLDVSVNPNNLPESLTHALAQSDLFIDELDLDELKRQIKDPGSRADLYLDMKINLSRSLSPVAWKKLRSVLKQSLGISFLLAPRVRPKVAFVAYTKSILNFGHGHVLNEVLRLLAKEQNIQMHSLYSLESIFKSDQGIGIPELGRLLNMEPEMLREMRQTALEGFWAGKSEKLQEVMSRMNQQLDATRSVSYALHLNLQSLSAINDFHLKSKRHAFFALRASALDGPEGILELLKSWNFEINRVGTCQWSFE